jgi:acyl-CoA thioester hydrolase
MPETGSFDGADHLYRVRVYYEDTDAAGVVYYANYLRMAERARTEMMRLAGADHAEMAAKDGVVLAVRDCTIEYLSPARLDDVVEIRTRITQSLGASLRAVQDFSRDGTVLARMNIRLACVGAADQPARLPPSVRAALARLDPQFMSAQKQRA